MNSEKIVLEYVWLGGSGELRSKARVINKLSGTDYMNPDNIPNWNYDGSSTMQAEGHDSEVIIVPVRICPCPFRKGGNLMVLCDGYNSKMEPAKNNNRVWAKSIFDQKIESKPWYGVEQEFFMIDPTTGMPLGFKNKDLNHSDNPKEQGQYYCSVGTENAFGRSVINRTLDNMIYAGLGVSGINAEVAPGQWEYQIGPVEGIDAGDQVWISRYILERTAEEFGVSIEYHPKPLEGDWNGSGCHTNYSTQEMRDEGGLKHIINAINKLEAKHDEHMKVYGSDNHMRMTGKHETARFDSFTYGKADRGASVRIGNHVYTEGKGYFEDRRPSSNMDPYLVTAKIFETTCL